MGEHAFPSSERNDMMHAKSAHFVGNPGHKLFENQSEKNIKLFQTAVPVEDESLFEVLS